MSGVRVIGVGTPYGDDRAGLEIAARLAALPGCGCEVVVTERPGAELIDLLGGADAVIVLDAVRSGLAPGTLHDLPLEDLAGAAGAGSAHGIGVAQALALARALGGGPRGRFIGIEAGPGRPAFAAALSAEVAAAVGTAAFRAQAWVDHYCGWR
jgi:hydrogenase maturation protease